MKITSELNRSITDNCIILPLGVILLAFEVALIFVRQANGDPITWHSILRVILVISIIVHQSLILRKKLALRKEKQEGGNDEDVSGR